MSDLPTLLPPSASLLSRATETAMAERITGLEAPISTLWNVDKCPVDLLPWLAWAFSVEVWDHGWTGEIKRNVIREAIRVHRLKGTRQSVEVSLSTLGFRTDISEWFEYGGAPHTFRLDAYADDVFAAGHQVNAGLLDTVTRLIKNVKPVRSHFALRIGQSFRMPVHARLAVTGRMRIAGDLRPLAPARTSGTDTMLRLHVTARMAIRDAIRPTAPARPAEGKIRARLCVTARRIIRDHLTFTAPKGAIYAA